MIPNLPPTEKWTSRPKGYVARILHDELDRVSTSLSLDMETARQFCSRTTNAWGILLVTSDGLLVQVQCGDGERDRTLVSVAKLEADLWPAYLEQRRICSRSNMDRVAGARLQQHVKEMLRDLRHPSSSGARVRVTEELLAGCCWTMMEREVLAPSRAHKALQDLREHVGADLTTREISTLVARASVRESCSRTIFAWPEVGAAAHDVVCMHVESLVVRAVRHDVR